MKHPETITEKRTQLVATARAMSESKLDLVEGCRLISFLRQEINPTSEEAEVLLPFVAVDAVTEDYPLNEVRARYCPHFLSQLDKEKEEYLSQVRPDLYRNCNRLIEIFSR